MLNRLNKEGDLEIFIRGDNPNKEKKYIMVILAQILGIQCKEEEEKLLESKPDFIIKIRYGILQHFSEPALFHTIRQSYTESSPYPRG